VAKLVRYKPSLIFKLAVFRLSHTHVHGGAWLNNEKVVTFGRVVKKRVFVSRIHDEHAAMRVAYGDAMVARETRFE